MPYNTQAILRPEEVTGTSALPLARVKKIIAQDDDIAQCSNGAAFAISIATEEFLRYLTEKAYDVAKSEAKPRRTIAYKDIANAVAKFDNLQFLSDTVPRTVTYKQVKEKRAAATVQPHVTTNAAANAPVEESKQKSIASMMQTTTNGSHRPATPPLPPIRDHSMANSPILDRTASHANGRVHSATQDEDVEMQD